MELVSMALIYARLAIFVLLDTLVTYASKACLFRVANKYFGATPTICPPFWPKPKELRRNDLISITSIDRVGKNKWLNCRSFSSTVSALRLPGITQESMDCKQPLSIHVAAGDFGCPVTDF